jgi:hypothetical protein
MNEHTEADYFGYLDDLRWAAGLPEIRSALEHQRPSSATDAVEQWRALGAAPKITLDISATYLLLSSLGFCRIGGVALPPDVARVLEHPLPAHVLVGALRALIHALEHLAADARELPERFDDAEPIEDVALCTSVLHQLMQTWAAFVAVNESYQEYLNAGGSSSGEFGRLMNEALGAFDRADEITQSDEQLRLLSVAVELPLLENLRRMLKGSFKETLPWWLDGTLERIAASKGDSSHEVIRGCEATGGRSTLRSAAALLIRRNQEIGAENSSYPLAANSRRAVGGVEEMLFQTRFPVAEDPQVSVRLQLNEDAAGCRQLRLVLVLK